MNNKGYEMYGQLQKLFNVWKMEFDKRGVEKFCKDGVIIFNTQENDQKQDYVVWCENKPRILTLFNDLNAANSDIPDQTRGNNFPPAPKFHRNLARYLYVVRQWYNKEKILKFEEIRTKFYSQEDRVKIFEAPYSYAHVNIKKATGGSSVAQKTIEDFFENDKEFLRQEIEILNPQIIVNCSKIGNEYIKFLCKDILCVKASHPSCRKKEEVIYKELVTNLSQIQRS